MSTRLMQPFEEGLESFQIATSSGLLYALSRVKLGMHIGVHTPIVLLEEMSVTFDGHIWR